MDTIKEMTAISVTTLVTSTPGPVATNGDENALVITQSIPTRE